ncbi:MAG: flagellar basal body rod protein FlgB [Xanthobacteraceae bacterium]|jgi:flagellar basal-body rod protein FlgB
MPISDFPILSMLRTRMQWHQERQRVLAENVANADTPNYRARDLAPPDFESVLQRTGSLTMARTDPSHMGPASGDSQFAEDRSSHYEIRPRGTAVTHEDEMLKLAGNQMDYDAVTSIYTHSLTLIKTAVGRS